jgi:DNA invertase Pin-like site-specific DNA recombinase
MAIRRLKRSLDAPSCPLRARVHRRAARRAQLHALRSYAEARGFEGVETYVNYGVSGARDRRPARDRLLADCRRRKVDVVAVTKLDRLGRSLRHLLILVGELDSLSVDFISLDDGLDTSTPSGRLFFQIRGAFAEYERSLIAERAAAGRAAAKTP